MSTEVMLVAQNIARNLGWPVFPCGWNSKTPTHPRSQGGRGFKDATVNPDEIKWLWRRWPGGLIGIATGEVSGIDCLMSILSSTLSHSGGGSLHPSACRQPVPDGLGRSSIPAGFCRPFGSRLRMKLRWFKKNCNKPSPGMSYPGGGAA
jgi:hypothetical protein